MMIPGRTYTSGNNSYRYGFNGQEKSDEIAGEGNHTTAKFWEYDPRLGRRWNLDPIYNTDISRYAVNGNNPNYFKDPLGDFKTKFGAQVYRFFNGGDVRKATGGKHAGEWYVGKRLEGLQGRKGQGKLADGSTELDEVVVGTSATFSWGKGNRNHPGNVIDNVADGANKSVDYLRNNASEIWNSPMARAIIPDYYTFSFNFQTSSVVTVGEEGTFTLLLRGKDPGLYFNTATSGGVVTALGVDVGASIGKGYFLGSDPRRFDSKVLGGWQASGSVGLGVSVGPSAAIGGSADVGFGEDGRPTTITGKIGVSFGLDYPTIIKVPIGVSGGNATNAKKLIGF